MDTRTPFAQTERKLFSRKVPAMGTFTLRPFLVAQDSILLHRWVTQPYAHFWGLQSADLAEVVRTYEELVSRPGYAVWLGEFEGQPAFLMEAYDPAQDFLAEHYATQPGDVGMHVLVGPPQQRLSGFTWAVFNTLMEFLFANKNTQRIVVEPDIRNTKIHALNRRAGFRYQDILDLPHKRAHLAVCTRTDYAQATAPPQVQVSPHFRARPEAWDRANRWLVAKALGEFTHEHLLTPELVARTTDKYQLVAPHTQATYQFIANRTALDHWQIAPESVIKLTMAGPQPIEAVTFIQEFQEPLGLPNEFLPTYLDEITSTLRSAVHKLGHHHSAAEDLIHADFQEIEHVMFEGHPVFVANSGRLGFGISDFNRYAPEANTPFRLVWVAAHRNHAQFTAVQHLSYDLVINQALGEETRRNFERQLQQADLVPEDYLLMPIHPWQWEHKISTHFAAALHRQHLVYLGEGPDRYSAQQSIRSLFNMDHPQHYYIKTALSILNMGFMRGLSAHYMASTPPITDWISDLLGTDQLLQAYGFEMLREVASVGYRHPDFEALGRTHINNKMLAALWRESPITKIEQGQSLMTMAALLHIDAYGKGLLGQLIRASGLSPQAWLRHYLQAYLTPLLHCFYQYGLVFMPHGENLILVFENYVPVRALMKDITEEVIVFDPKQELPEAAARLYVETSDEQQLLYLFTDVFDCFFRFLGAQLPAQKIESEELFWEQVALVVHDYQAQYPEQSAAFARWDLFQPTFQRCCLNRLQLSNTKHMLDLADPINSLQFSGTLENPIAKYR